jgi:signal transduction histidine kinase
MKERVKLMGGSCQIESQPGQGANVSVRVPTTRGAAIAED